MIDQMIDLFAKYKSNNRITSNRNRPRHSTRDHKPKLHQTRSEVARRGAQVAAAIHARKEPGGRPQGVRNAASRVEELETKLEAAKAAALAELEADETFQEGLDVNRNDRAKTERNRKARRSSKTNTSAELPGNFPRRKGFTDIASDEMFFSLSTTSLPESFSITKPPKTPIPTADFNLTLANISMNILSMAESHPALRGTRQTDPEGAVNHVLKQYAALSDELRDIPGVISQAAEEYTAFEGIAEDDILGAVVHIIEMYKDIVDVYQSEMISIPKMILDASKEYQSLKGIDPNDPHGAVHHLLKTYQSLVHLYWQTVADVKRLQPLDVKCANLEKDLKEAGSKLKQSRKAEVALSQKNQKLVADLEDENKKHTSELSSLKKKLDKDHEVTKTQKSNLEKKQDEIALQHKTEMKKLRSSNEQRLKDLGTDLEKTHAENLRAITQVNKNAVDALQAALDKEIDARKADNLFTDAKHKKAMKDIIDEHKEVMQNATDKHKKERSEWETLMEEMLTSHELFKQKLLKDFEVERRQLAENFKEQTEDLHNELQEVKSKLVKREHFSKSFPDEEIRNRFSTIAQLVTEFVRDLARRKWESKHSFQFSEEQLQLFCKATRTFKMHLLTNTVWMILFDQIFSMPFKVLGSEGNVLDISWVSKFWSSESVKGEWPYPTDESEKSRSETAARCFKAINSKGEASDNDRNLRSSYTQSVSRIVQEISQSVIGVSHLDQYQIEGLNRLVSSAAMLWLEVGSERYRILVEIPGDITNQLASKSVPDTMILLKRPRLTRKGDKEGKDILAEKIVSDWELSDVYSKQGSD